MIFPKLIWLLLAVNIQMVAPMPPVNISGATQPVIETIKQTNITKQVIGNSIQKVAETVQKTNVTQKLAGSAGAVKTVLETEITKKINGTDGHPLVETIQQINTTKEMNGNLTKPVAQTVVQTNTTKTVDKGKGHPVVETIEQTAVTKEMHVASDREARGYVPWASSSSMQFRRGRNLDPERVSKMYEQLVLMKPVIANLTSFYLNEF